MFNGTVLILHVTVVNLIKRFINVNYFSHKQVSWRNKLTTIDKRLHNNVTLQIPVKHDNTAVNSSSYQLPAAKSLFNNNTVHQRKKRKINIIKFINSKLFKFYDRFLYYLLSCLLFRHDVLSFYDATMRKNRFKK